jgi:twitching motility protein PilT
MALFQSEFAEVIKKLANKTFATPEERDELLGRVEAAEGLRARDVAWMLFRPDRAMRESGARALGHARDPETVDAFLNETRNKPEPAVRAAAAALFALPIAGIDARMAQLLVPPPKPSKEIVELQDAARRLLLEAPIAGGIEQLLWQQASVGAAEERLPFLNKLASGEIRQGTLPRWTQLAADPDHAIRDKALEVLAARAPEAAAETLVQELPRASFATQQMIVEGLTRVAVTAGAAFADRLLPLIASGDAGTRTAVLKILMAIGDPAAVIRRYIEFAKSLAGFVRERTIDSLRAFGDQLIEPVIGLLRDPDLDTRAGAIAVATVFDDKRIVPATIELLKDSDWWLRISAADTLGRLRDPRAVEPLVAALADPDVKWAAVEALGRIADLRSLPALGKMLADPAPDVRIEVMQALRKFKHPQVRQALMQMAQTDPVRSVRGRAVDMLDELSLDDRGSQMQIDAIRQKALTASGRQGEPRLHTLLIATRNQAASDFHLSVGQPPILRMAADLIRAKGEPFTAQQTEAMLKEILTEAQWATLESTHQLDFCYYIPQAGRYRGNVFFDHRGYNAVFRVIPERPPTILEIGLPPHLAEISDFHQGLVLICGPSGSGKSTTLAALVNLFNETRTDHVITMEDPIEFVHPFKNCLINQREVGSHTGSFARALRAALREDPDVIVIGELRDNESITLALTAAETGHIVLGTLTATSASKAVDRILSSFPADEQPQIRASLSESLKYVIAQRLLPSKEPRKQVAAFEILKGTTNIANMIRDEKTYQIHSAMQIGRSQGMQLFDEALRDLVKREQIAPETAYMAAQKKEDFEALVPPEFLERAKW